MSIIETEKPYFTGQEAIEAGRDRYEEYMRRQRKVADICATSVLRNDGVTDDIDLFLSTFMPYSPDGIVTRSPEHTDARTYTKSRLEIAQGSVGKIAVLLNRHGATTPLAGGFVRMKTPFSNPPKHHGDAFDLEKFSLGSHLEMRVVEIPVDATHQNLRVHAQANLHVVNPETEESRILTVVHANGLTPFGSYTPAGQGVETLIGMEEIQDSSLNAEWKKRVAMWAEDEAIRRQRGV